LIDVLYESTTTISIESEYIDSIWRDGGLVKKDGYKIDDVVSFVKSTGEFTDINFLVVMSKPW
jgi:hypothetical protein